MTEYDSRERNVGKGNKDLANRKIQPNEEIDNIIHKIEQLRECGISVQTIKKLNELLSEEASSQNKQKNDNQVNEEIQSSEETKAIQEKLETLCEKLRNGDTSKETVKLVDELKQTLGEKALLSNDEVYKAVRDMASDKLVRMEPKYKVIEVTTEEEAKKLFDKLDSEVRQSLSKDDMQKAKRDQVLYSHRDYPHYCDDLTQYSVGSDYGVRVYVVDYSQPLDIRRGYDNGLNSCRKFIDFVDKNKIANVKKLFSDDSLQILKIAGDDLCHHLKFDVPWVEGAEDLIKHIEKYDDRSGSYLKKLFSDYEKIRDTLWDALSRCAGNNYWKTREKVSNFIRRYRELLHEELMPDVADGWSAIRVLPKDH